MFEAVITGNTSYPGVHKVLNSTEDDHVFMYWDDHGVPCGLMFGPPLGTEYYQWWFKPDIDRSLKTMFDKKMYKRMIILVEACNSGCLFEDLDPKMNIWAMTAANQTMPSKGIYCRQESKLPDGTMFPYCLGDMFTINVMNDVEAFDGRPRKLKDHWKTVVNKTATTKDRAGDYVSSWGNEEIRDNFTIEDFWGITHREPHAHRHHGEDNSVSFFKYIS